MSFFFPQSVTSYCIGGIIISKEELRKSGFYLDTHIIMSRCPTLPIKLKQFLLLYLTFISFVLKPLTLISYFLVRAYLT